MRRKSGRRGSKMKWPACACNWRTVKSEIPQNQTNDESMLSDHLSDFTITWRVCDARREMMQLALALSSLQHTDEELQGMQRPVESAEQGAIDAHAALKHASETMEEWRVWQPPLGFCHTCELDHSGPRHGPRMGWSQIPFGL